MQEKEDGMKRAIFLATAALLAMLVLAPRAFTQDSTVVAQDSTMIDGKTFLYSVGDGAILETTIGDGISAGGPTPTTGGPAILLPAVALLLGSGILTYAILRRR
jgi:hypothetical protein